MISYDFFLGDVDRFTCNGVGGFHRGTNRHREGSQTTKFDMTGINDVVGHQVQNPLEKMTAHSLGKLEFF